MKKNLQLIAFTFVAMFLFAHSGMAQFVAQKLDHPVSAPADTKEGVWIHYDSGESDNALGLSDGAVFQSAIRWEPADLADFDGMHITSIRVYIADLPEAASVLVYQGADAASLVELANQSFEPVETSWNEVMLDEPVAIDASLELWIATEIDDAGDGLFSSGMDTSVDAIGFGNMVNLGTGWDILTDLADIPGVFALQAYVEPAEPSDNYMVTFRVNMGPAVADGFDPETHNVVVTGDFAGWTEPGQEGSVEMTMEAPAKDAHTFYDDFSDYDDFTTDLSPWINIDTHGNGTWGSEGFSWEGESTAFGWMVMNPAATDPDITGDNPAYAGSKYVFSVASNPVTPTGEENKWLISPAMTVTADSELSFAAKSITDQYGMERMKVYVSTTGTAPEDFTLISEGDFIEIPTSWTEYSFGLGDYDGETIHFAVENVSSDAFMMFLDAFTVTNLDVEPVDDLFFTATVEIPAGDIAYKYFSNAFGEGWAGGEWEAGDDRTATIDADVTLTSVWGVPDPVSVNNVLAESGLNLFPNPVRNTLYVENAAQINEVRIFDLTGRLVMSQVVNNNTASVNVSEFNRGVYIMQIVSENGVASQKFNVIK